MLVLEKAPREWAGGNSAFTAGAMRFAHGGLEDVRDLVEDDERHAVTGAVRRTTDFAADLERVTLGRGDPRRWRACWSATPATRCAGCAARGIRFRLMYERQAYEGDDGRWTFWGGLAVGAVDGGRGLIDQHARGGASGPGSRSATTRRSSALAERRASCAGPTARARRCAPASVVLAAGGFEANPEWRTRYLGPNWDLAPGCGAPA